MIIQKQNHHKALYLKAKTMIFYLFNYKTRVAFPPLIIYYTLYNYVNKILNFYNIITMSYN